MLVTAPRCRFERHPLLTLTLIFITGLLAIALYFDPSTVRRTSFGQPFGTVSCTFYFFYQKALYKLESLPKSDSFFYFYYSFAHQRALKYSRNPY